MEYRIDNDAMYFMQLGGGRWYRIPPQMVVAYVDAGAWVKESGARTNRVSTTIASNGSFKTTKT
jgi:hypothetical protein